MQELLVNLVLVLGLQAFTGLTGVLSFGHLAFAQIAAYAVALVTIPVATKATTLPDLPFGIDDVHVSSLATTVIAVAVATALGAIVGSPFARATGIAATMITLAVLFVVDSVVKNWQELTHGAGGLSGIPRHGSNVWLWLAVAGALVVLSALFRETHVGRFAIATREDEIAAPAIGIDLFWPRWTAWTLSITIVAVAARCGCRPWAARTRSSTRSTSACCCSPCSSSAGCARSPARSSARSSSPPATRSPARSATATRSPACPSCSSAGCCWP